LKKGSLEVRNCEIINNTTHGNSNADNMHGSGGGIKAGEGELRIYNSLIKGNSANRHGGGIKSGCLCSLIVENCRILDNETRMNGGGIHVKGTIGNPETVGTALITDSVIKENRASLAGGVYNEGTMSLIKTTIKDNQAGNKYGCHGLLNATYGTILLLEDCRIDELRGFKES